MDQNSSCVAELDRLTDTELVNRVDAYLGLCDAIPHSTSLLRACRDRLRSRSPASERDIHFGPISTGPAPAACHTIGLVLLTPHAPWVTCHECLRRLEQPAFRKTL